MPMRSRPPRAAAKNIVASLILFSGKPEGFYTKSTAHMKMMSVERVE
jgi:hypothetical protein